MKNLKLEKNAFLEEFPDFKRYLNENYRGFSLTEPEVIIKGKSVYWVQTEIKSGKKESLGKLNLIYERYGEELINKIFIEGNLPEVAEHEVNFQYTKMPFSNIWERRDKWNVPFP